tara:strand:- start:882 stop:1115 length:234 start_codon:yes stop_codon:yes gene_type:complete
MIEKKIIEILNSIIKNNIDLRKNKKLVTDGHLDSFSVLLLISKIEQTFKIKIKLEKFDINYFNSVASIKKLVSKNND